MVPMGLLLNGYGKPVPRHQDLYSHIMIGVERMERSDSPYNISPKDLAIELCLNRVFGKRL